ncbi:unnamed protein product [Camellia sinensis]
MYTHGRTLKVGGRPLMLLDPFEPLLKVAYSLSCFTVDNFEPQGCVKGTWEDTNVKWPATNSTWPF